MQPIATSGLQKPEKALSTMTRADKGPVSTRPMLAEPMRMVADAVASWPGVIATTHWHLHRRSQVDGIDFYVAELELGHIHLDGSIHLATSPTLGQDLVMEGLAHPFRYVLGWVEQEISAIGENAAVALFRRNYEQLSRQV